MASSASSLPSSASSTPSPASPASPASASYSGASGAAHGSVSVGEDLLSPGSDRSPEEGQGWKSETSAQAQDGRSGPEALDRWVERLHAGIDRLADAAAPRLQRLQEGMSATRGTLRRQAGLVREDGEEWAESLRCSVREHPVTAVAVAVAFGMLLARLSR